MEIIGSGIDIVEVKRLRRTIKRWGDQFLRRVFTETEMKYAGNRRALYEHLAGRFAAKEAIIKATNVGELAFTDIEIINNKTGKPCATIINKKSANKKYAISVSISHIKDYAVANAVVTTKD
ncbi:MAG: holo-[acyl-carrier-protein] synthase [Candidatus Omnitrophica bacterium CG11_big_fil_rev_8_21_14_0_20_42_13]|uniref:Holo-[acyl-carrier-protein] synthase n=1 Tax=Candidatus Ghiorseimicrobium undicola TaxID=1974746 RepID=A0A2H0M043_9BACT|nr:MAG: holo-[acyl-carrier-protein] synthase [Candidatus Omnitrophica bacterium CG11_big_fil_rev_8_21_14_0_20_42_13]